LSFIRIFYSAYVPMQEFNAALEGPLGGGGFESSTLCPIVFEPSDMNATDEL